MLDKMKTSILSTSFAWQTSNFSTTFPNITSYATAVVDRSIPPNTLKWPCYYVPAISALDDLHELEKNTRCFSFFRLEVRTFFFSSSSVSHIAQPTTILASWWFRFNAHHPRHSVLKKCRIISNGWKFSTPQSISFSNLLEEICAAYGSCSAFRAP